MATVNHVPLLAVARDLYRLPRDMTRFKRYLEVMKGGAKDDVELVPLVAMNPMARSHVAEAIDRWIALGAEDTAARACADAARRLPRVDGAVKAGLVVCDDVAGGWTDRHLTEAETRLKPASAVKRGWAPVLLWAGEAPSLDALRGETLAAVYRFFHARRHGPPATLGEAMRQEGRAARFAGRDAPPLDAAARETLRAHAAARDWAMVFAGMYGDETARKVGHAPLGVPERAGFAAGLADALSEGEPGALL